MHLLYPVENYSFQSTEIDLSKKHKIDIFFLIVQESRGSAGGRGGGSGARHIERIFGYACDKGDCKIIFDTSDESKIEKFEIPYSAVAMDIRLQDGNDIWYKESLILI